MTFKENSFQFNQHQTEPNSYRPTELEIAKRTKELYGQSLELESRKIENCDFDIDIKKNGKHSEISVRNKKGETIDLSSYMDKNCHFMEGYEFVHEVYPAATGRKEIETISYRPITNQSAFLVSLFHEMGHSDAWHSGEENIEPSFMDKIVADFESLFERIKKINTDRRDGGIRDALITDKLLKEYVNPNEFTPLWYQDKKQKLISRSERNAWAFALRSLRDLQKKGISAFDGFANFSELRSYIDTCLLTYEEERILDRKYFFADQNSNQLEKKGGIEPIFVRKRVLGRDTPKN